MAAAAAVVGIDLGAGALAGRFRRLDAGNSGDGRDIGGDVLEVIAFEDAGGHGHAGVVTVDVLRTVNLGPDDALDRVGIHAGGTGCGESVIQVGALGASAGRLGQNVAGAAVRIEELTASILESELLRIGVR